MAWFGAFRNHYQFTWYGDNRTSVSVDLPLLAVAYFCVLVAVATLISTLGIRGRERWATTLRAGYAVAIASIILVCLVGKDWRVGSAEITSHYLYRSNKPFHGTVGVRVALSSCNVTLDGYFGEGTDRGYVYYAETFKWTDYGREQETMRGPLQQGLPHPLLTVIEFLSVDGGGLRWGRHFHLAGYFGCALLWTALAFWIISNVLLMSVVCYGAFMFFLTGVAMVLTCVVYHVCQPPLELQIDFGSSVLKTHYGWCFWLTLFSGIVTLTLGGVLFIVDNVFHEKVSEFFNLETLDEEDMYEFSPPHPNQQAVDKLSGGSMLYPGGANGGGPGSAVATTTTSGARLSFTSGLMHKQASGARRGSLQHLPGHRRGSIFLEPERRPCETGPAGTRRGSFFSGAGLSNPAVGFCHPSSAVGALAFSNKGFELDRCKSNPIFSAHSSAADIQEEGEERERSLTSTADDVKVELGGEVLNKPPLPPSSSSNSSGQPGGGGADRAYSNPAARATVVTATSTSVSRATRTASLRWPP